MRRLKRDIWPYSITLYNPDNRIALGDIHKWCTETQGYRFKDWYSYLINTDQVIYAFKSESDLLVFKLKWGNYATR